MSDPGFGTPAMPPVFLVEEGEDPGLAPVLRAAAMAEVVVAESGELIPLMLHQKAATVVLHLAMAEADEQELLPEIIRHFPDTPVVVVAHTQQVEHAVACMREGAFDYLVQPVEPRRLVESVRRAVDTFLLRQEVYALKSHLTTGGLRHQEAFGRILTNSHQVRGIFQYVEAVAGSGETLLITGETGVGKGLLAEAAHRISNRTGEFVSLNVAGLDDTLFSDTLFGHRKGAFSGADTNREGLVARAGRGTLFLDEIGDLKHASQVKLLRLLQEQSYYPLGSDVPKLSSARIVAATNHDLRKLIAAGLFRQDLFYRLSAHRVEIPALRERKEDIPLLLGYFLQEACRAMSKTVPDIPPQLITLLAAYPFPGNVREMRAMVYDAVARHPGGPTLSMDSFHKAVRESLAATWLPSDSEGMDAYAVLAANGSFPRLKEAVDGLVREAMRRADNNQGIAATLLGITRQSLNRRLLKLRQSALE